MKYFLFFILFCMTVCVVGDELKTIPSPKQLWDNSDIIAAIRIIEGKIVGERYQLVGEVDSLFKGEIKGDRLHFSHNVNYYSDLPASLGKTYLIFLESKAEHLVTIDFPLSVIEYGKLYVKRDDIDLVFNKMGLNKVSGVNIDDNFFLYPERCIDASEFICSKSVEVLKYVTKTGLATHRSDTQAAAQRKLQKQAHTEKHPQNN